MSAIDELGIKWDHIHTNGFSADILAGIFELDDQRIKQADDIKQLRAAIEQRDLRIAGLDERLKAVNGMVERHIRLHIKEELAEPAPAPDLLEASTSLMEYLQSPQCAVENFDIPDDIYGPFVDAVKKGGCAPAPDLEAQITKTIEDIKYLFLLPPDIDIPATEGHLRQLLRAFAAELGVK